MTYVVDQSKQCAQIYLQKIACCLNFAIINSIFLNRLLKTCIFIKNKTWPSNNIDFQQNRVCRSVKTVHTNLFAQYRKLHKFATINSNFEKKKFFLTCIIIKRTCISIFSKIILKHKS